MLVYGFHVPSWKCNVDEKKICNILNYSELWWYQSEQETDIRWVGNLTWLTEKGWKFLICVKKKPFKPQICASYLAQQAKDSRHFFLVCGIVNSHGALDPPWPWRRHLARTCVVVVLFLALDLQQNGKSSNRTSPCPCKSWFSTLSPTHSASSS